jgi:hypothetical protein
MSPNSRPIHRPVDPSWSEDEIERYIQLQIRPLEERVRGALLSSAAQRDRSSGRELMPSDKRRRSGEVPAANAQMRA